jgi:thymidylate synthase (FAD)
MINVKLIAITQGIKSESPENIITKAGRVCYDSKASGRFDDFITARIRDGHTSVLEHIQFTFEISGISRSCLAQLTRHRIASFSVQSQRRVDMSDARFVVPPSIRGNHTAEAIFTDAIEHSRTAYTKLRELGIRKQDCRFVLPISAETKLAMSANVRSLRHFLEVRCDGGAQWEIRTLAERMLQVAYRKMPAAFEDLYVKYIKGKDY